MHNLFSGTAKHMWRHWHQNLKLFSAKDIDIINERLESMLSVTDNGWLPKSIGTNCGVWTAFQWKAWALVYSPYCLVQFLVRFL